VRVAGLLHVTNGDAPVFDIALAAGVRPADVVPWRDVLHDGPVPDALDPEELARVRARHLASNGWTSEESALRELRARDDRLVTHPAEAEVVLWFEDDLYDALQLAQIADRLAGRPGPVTLVRLPHGPRDDLPDAFEARAPFAPDPAPFAALRSPDPRGWAAHGRMARLLEELPDTRTGLSRLEREILEALAVARPPHELFEMVAAREQPPWLGDATVFAAADRLRPLVTTEGGGYALTPEGHAVLAGEASRPPYDHWVGGVHLAPGLPRWAWDAAAGEAVRLD
jgi:hypothetical protein